MELLLKDYMHAAVQCRECKFNFTMQSCDPISMDEIGVQCTFKNRNGIKIKIKVLSLSAPCVPV